jgi:hypothetical protein
MSGSAGEIARMLNGLIKAIKCDVGDLRDDKKADRLIELEGS